MNTKAELTLAKNYIKNEEGILIFNKEIKARVLNSLEQAIRELEIWESMVAEEERL